MVFICVHAGAGFHKNKFKYEQILKVATLSALEILEKDGSALDAVAKAIESLENDGITNCGKGSALNINGEIQCDASLMQSSDLNWAGVGAISNVKNPILVVKELILFQQVVHPDGLLHPCFLAGLGATKWAESKGFELCYDLKTLSAIKAFEKNRKKISKLKYFDYNDDAIDTSKKKKIKTELNSEQSMSNYNLSIKCIEEEHKYYRKKLDENESVFKNESIVEDYQEVVNSNLESQDNVLLFNDKDDVFFDTVGATAIDNFGVVASGVSSGGIIYKDEGRIGQSGMYGCGCWAEDNVGLSTSGIGEYLIKTIFAKKCAKKLIKSDKMNSLTTKQTIVDTFDKYFLNSRYLKKADHPKHAGILAAILHKNDKKVEVVWAHNCSTMCISYASKQDNFVMEMSKNKETMCNGEYELFVQSCLVDI